MNKYYMDNLKKQLEVWEGEQRVMGWQINHLIGVINRSSRNLTVEFVKEDGKIVKAVMVEQER